MPSVEIFQDEAGGWRYRIKGDNNEIVASSESYTTKESAQRGAKDLADVVGKAEVQEGKDS